VLGLRCVLCNEGLKDREERMTRQMKRREVPLYTLASGGQADLGDVAPWSTQLGETSKGEGPTNASGSLGSSIKSSGGCVHLSYLALDADKNMPALHRTTP
jgi:hypothetical protein